MRTAEQIAELLPKLEQCVADDLEDQDLDFKEWNRGNPNEAVKKVVRMAVCMANGGGGTVVFGVREGVKGRASAIPGIPVELDISSLKRAVYDQTDPRITPVFEEIVVPEGTGRLLIMQIYPGFPPYTDSAGVGTIRIGKDCKPLTGSMRGKIGMGTAETDYTAEAVASFDAQMISATAMEALRAQAITERAPEDLVNLPDIELLNALGLIRLGKVTRAGVLLAGTETAVREYVPGHNWTFLQMTSETGYGIREDRISALPLSIQRIEDLLVPFNPITTYEQGLFHFEYSVWPHIAVREALMNAFCHADFRIAGPVMVKLYPEHLEIGNNGGFIAGITPNNILHHPPAARNPLLVDALTRLRLVNRSNLGISRMFNALLMEGKEPPVIRETGESVLISFPRHELNAAFRLFVAEEGNNGHILGVDELLLLRYLLLHPEVDTATAARLCQRSETQIRERLSGMEALGYIEHGGSTRGAYWSINPTLHSRLADDGQAARRRRIAWETAKLHVLDILKRRAERGETGPGNKEIRSITRFSRSQVTRLMSELRLDYPSVQISGHGAGAVYEWRDG